MTLLVITVAISLIFDFTNGFHDTANAVATSVSTRALSPRLAVLIAAIANLGGAFATTAVAKTVGKGIIDSGLATEKTVLAAVIGAIVWNLITWWLGLPSSSSHALIGGLVGAALAQSGEHGVLWHGIAHKVVIPAIWARLRSSRASCSCSRSCGASSGSRQVSRTAPSASVSSRRAPGWRSRTAPTTRRRRWA
jgi:PiT family inorganic phosphate transporter